MSTVFVHVGQAGCQLAEALWPVLARERCGAPDLFDSFASGGAPRPRAVLVDAEPKVVHSVLASGATSGTEYSFDPTCIALAESGHGGNFAFGYAAERGQRRNTLPLPAALDQPRLVDQAIEVIRRQVEGCNGTHLGTVVVHSLGGGTGSGLGIRLVEELRDAYSSSALLSTSMLPIAVGENPVQSFNAILALSSLQELVDGVVLYENDRLLSVVEGSFLRSSNTAAVTTAAPVDSVPDRLGTSFSAMNALVVNDLAPFLCSPQPTQPFDPFDLLARVCPAPTHHFVQAFSGEAMATHGPSELRTALNALVRATPRAPRVPTGAGSILASQVVVRGTQVLDAAALQADLLERCGGTASWQPFVADVHTNAAPLSSAPHIARVSVLLNWRRTAQIVRALVARARRKYASRAFVHWYEYYGLGPDTFAHAFEVLDEVATNYEAV